MSRGTRDNLRQLAKDDGVTLDEELTRLVRGDRQRRMGQALAASSADAEERAWLEMGVEAVGSDASW
ncbi:MAG TPA: hypothetical protein VE760_00010 [Acidimicrobiales bacterium]|nr:hypothetical protein [Acidimicrobiales bacterium]